MKSFYLKSLIIIVLVAVGVAMAIAGCGGSGTTTTVSTRTTVLPVTATTTTTTALVSIPLDELSTFESKDPFIQQALAPTTTTTGTGSTTTTKPGTTSTTKKPGTTSTTVPTTVTSPTHKLKVLSIDVMNGTPVVTFQVDGTVYADKKVGDSVSTAWGGIKVLAIDPQAQTVTLLHGSEVRTLGVGQQILK
jgi:hypothetical protein